MAKNYKGKYCIVFYDKTDEELLYIFDNVDEILHFKGLQVTTYNKQELNVCLYRSLRTDTHFTKILGEVMRVYLIERDEENE